jgi:hypothetical protein
VKPVVRVRQIKPSPAIFSLHENLTKSAVLVQAVRMLLQRIVHGFPGALTIELTQLSG